LYEIDFGALEGAYVADRLPYLRTLQDLWRYGQTIIPVCYREDPEQVFARVNGFVKEVVLE
tara:strand:- start:8230 stop:8412 length:183 start_codon:yes stop_codon:yes gene_type:complete